jgi:hypothetical protein
LTLSPFVRGRVGEGVLRGKGLGPLSLWEKVRVRGYEESLKDPSSWVLFNGREMLSTGE